MSASNVPVLSMGPGTCKIPLKLFEKNRERLCEKLREKLQEDGMSGKVLVLLQGGQDVPFNDTDVCYNFRQESYFMWAFGVVEPGCYGIIDVTSGASYVFVPHLPEDWAVWMGPLLTTNDFQKKYQTNYVHYVTEMEQVLQCLKPQLLLLLNGVNSDSDLETVKVDFPGMETYATDDNILHPIISNLRVFKTDLEIEVMRYVVDISSAAHRKVMKFAKKAKNEYQCEAEFLHYCYSIGGCRNVSYTCVCGTGKNSAVLHYGHAGAPNNKLIQKGDMCLFDMGANYFGYSADITCSFPSSGKFTDDQVLIYEAVLDANSTVMSELKPGVNWVDMHLLGLKIILEHLKAAEIIKGSIDAMLEDGLGSIFQPHGLGHLLGLDVHDVGGYLPTFPKRPPSVNSLNKLRTARVLEEGMVLTVEPGCYFIDPLLDKAFQDEKLSKYLVKQTIERFRGFGGVRIEDDVLITAGGCENLTKVPRSVREIESWMSQDD